MDTYMGHVQHVPCLVHNSGMPPVTKVTFTSIFHPFFLIFSIPLPLRGGKLPTKRPYCGIPGHYSLLGLSGQHSLHSLLGITKTMTPIMMTGVTVQRFPETSTW